MMMNSHAIAHFKMNRPHHHIYCTDKNHIVTSLNEQQAMDCGFDDFVTCVGKYVYDFYLDKKTADVFITNNETILKTGNTCVFYENGITNSGEDITCISHKFPVRNDKGKIIGVMGMSIPHIATLTDEKLSSQQSTCLSFLCRGMTAREIALQMQLSIRTVEHYIAAIKQKLNVKNTKELIAKYS